MTTTSSVSSPAVDPNAVASVVADNESFATVRTGTSVASLKKAFLDNLFYIQGKFPPIATKHDYYMALAYTIRDHLMNVWTKSAQTYLAKTARTVCYMSAEFLIGPQMGNNINSLGLYNNLKQAMDELGLHLDQLVDQELEPGLGNGGLGRLAACYMDSMATLNIPAIGYGIRYEFGIFDQEIRSGWQVECTDKWLRFGNPWEVARPEIAIDIRFGGRTERYTDIDGRQQVRWIADHMVKAVAHDMPIIGYKASAANFLRLWKAEACESFDFQAFNVGDYYGAVNAKMASENITKVLYPNDEPLVGRKLRLQQQYFFVSSSLQDMIRIYKQRQADLSNFHEKYVVQLNDTHPSIAIAELMRLLIDEYKMGWDQAWVITQKTFCYTNHTVMAEALEKWPVALFASVLPRHLEIIYEINARFLNDVRQKFPHDDDRVRRLSFIDESGERYVRMTNLACVGSHAINGVSQLHTDLLKQQVLHDFYEMWPEKFSNKTNGITPRRFLQLSNQRLANLITAAIGDGWIKNLDELRKLEKLADDKAFQEEWYKVKQSKKEELAKIIHDRTPITVHPESLFDIQTKRIHEYKRQHLNILHVITLYNRLRRNPNIDFTPRTVIFAGKAAPAYKMAKLIIKLITSVAGVVNYDPAVRDRLKVVFVPNFNVKEAQHIYPAANLSEQISTAGKEASGTGNMKFSLNGALTIGTLDGANIEMREEFGADNFFLFGLRTEEVMEMKSRGYNPSEMIKADDELREAIELIAFGHFSKHEPNLFRPLLDTILQRDEFMLCADYRSYVDCQTRVGEIYRDRTRWTKMSILNVARMGKFSSDRAIREYADDIWHISPIAIDD
jgi:glycogen phosphorylase